MSEAKKNPVCCANCRRFWRNGRKDEDGTALGNCDEWATAGDIREDSSCDAWKHELEFRK